MIRHPCALAQLQFVSCRTFQRTASCPATCPGGEWTTPTGRSSWRVRHHVVAVCSSDRSVTRSCRRGGIDRTTMTGARTSASRPRSSSIVRRRLDLEQTCATRRRHRIDPVVLLLRWFRSTATALVLWDGRSDPLWRFMAIRSRAATHPGNSRVRRVSNGAQNPPEKQVVIETRRLWREKSPSSMQGSATWLA